MGSDISRSATDISSYQVDGTYHMVSAIDTDITTLLFPAVDYDVYSTIPSKDNDADSYTMGLAPFPDPVRLSRRYVRHVSAFISGCQNDIGIVSSNPTDNAAPASRGVFGTLCLERSFSFSLPPSLSLLSCSRSLHVSDVFLLPVPVVMLQGVS